jgi:hypothetical protein
VVDSSVEHLSIRIGRNVPPRADNESPRHGLGKCQQALPLLLWGNTPVVEEGIHLTLGIRPSSGVGNAYQRKIDEASLAHP